MTSCHSSKDCPRTSILDHALQRQILAFGHAEAQKHVSHLARKQLLARTHTKCRVCQSHAARARSLCTVEIKVHIMLRTELQVPCTHPARDLHVSRMQPLLGKDHFLHNTSRTRQPACARVGIADHLPQKCMHVISCAQQWKNKSAAKHKEHRHGSLQKSWRLPNGPPNRHATTSTSVTAPASRLLNTAPGGLAYCPTAGCISRISALLSQRLAVCVAMSEQTRLCSNSPSNTRKHHHDDTCENTVLNLHFLVRSPRCSLFTVVQSGLLEMCGSEPPSLCNTFTSSYCPAPGSLCFTKQLAAKCSESDSLRSGCTAVSCRVFFFIIFHVCAVMYPDQFVCLYDTKT